MKIHAISDLHGGKPPLPGGDLLIIAGDLCYPNTEQQYKEFDTWLGTLKYEKIIVLAGNHDGFLYDDRFADKSPFKHGEYLCDEEITYKGLRIYGCPWTPLSPIVKKCYRAFMIPEMVLPDRYQHIPENLDILVCHGPAYALLDSCDGRIIGSPSLRKELDEKKPRILIHGHCHEDGGKELLYKNGPHDTWIYNVAYLDARYKQREGVREIILTPKIDH